MTTPESARIAVLHHADSAAGSHVIDLLSDTGDALEVATVSLEAIAASDDAAVADLARALVIVLADDVDIDLRDAYARAREHSPAPIIVFAHERLSSDLLEEAAHLGAFDMLDPDIDAPHLRFSIDRALQLAHPDAASEPAQVHAPRVVSVLAVRGGAGATTIAVNLATAKSRLWGRDVLLLDLDLDGADVALACGIDADRTVIDLVRSHGDVDWSRLRSYLMHHPAGFAVLPGARWTGDASKARPELLLDLLQAARGHADMVIADLPQSFAPATLAALDRSDALLLVLTPEVASVKHAAQALERLDRLGFPADRIHLVLNRATMPGALARRDVEAAVGRRIAVSIADDAAVVGSLNRGVPLVQLAPSSPAVHGVVSLTELLGEHHDAGLLDRARHRLFDRRRSTPARHAGHEA